MTITEAKQAWGDFTVTLIPETPREIISRLMQETAIFGFVRVFPQRTTHDIALTNRDTDLFAGVLTRRPDRYTLAGHSVTMLLGENSGSKELYSDELGPINRTTPIAYAGTADGDVRQWVGAALDVNGCVIQRGNILGSGYPDGTRFGNIFVRKTPKTLLDTWICPRFRVNYRVNPNLTLDVGEPTDLWPFAEPFPLAIKRGGRDLNVEGLNAVELSLEVDYSEWVYRVLTWIENPPALGEDSTTRPYKSARDGTAFNWTRVQTGQSGASNADAVSDANDQSKQAHAGNLATRTVSISTNEFAITRRVAPGEQIYVYDYDAGLYDQSNTLIYQGRHTYPVKLRVEGVTWPIQQGMAVWWDNRHTNGESDLIELTSYIDYESEGTDTTLTVGSPPKTLGRVLRVRR